MSRTKKNTLLTSCLLLALTLLGTGCADSGPLQRRYEIERSLFEIDRLRDKLLIRPELITPADSDTLRARYYRAFTKALEYIQEVNTSTHRTEIVQLRSLAYRAAESARRIDFSRRNFTQALEVMELLLTSVELSRPERLMAKVALGQAAQASGDWPRARETFKEIVADYYPPLAPTGQVISSALNLPYDIYRVERHLKVHPALGELADETEDHYLKILDGNFSPDLNIATHAILSSFYQSEGRFDEALTQLERIVDSTGAQMFEAKLRAWNILINDKGFYRPALEDISRELALNTDTLLTPIFHFKRAECYIGLRLFDSCRNELNILKNDHRTFFYNNPTAQTLIARSFELDGKWNRAENEYRWLGETFATEAAGFRSYLYILDHYEQTENAELHGVWSQRALDFYTESAMRYPNTAIEATALSFQAEIHRRNQDWPAAARALEQVAEKHPETDIGRNSALGAAILYRSELGDSARAESLLVIYRSGFPADNKSTR